MAKLSAEVTEQDHIQGEDGAAVTLVEYGDFQCPHCAMAHAIVERLRRHFGAKLRFVYRNFPLVEIHPMAEPAAEAAEFAAAEGKFWPMHDAIFAHQRSLSEKSLAEAAEGLGLDGQEAGAAVSEQRFADRIERDMESGVESGVHGTPTFFINGEGYAGAWDFDELREAIEEAM